MSACTGLYIIGQFYNYGGISDMAHQYARACESAGIPARLIPTGDTKPEVKAKWEKRVNDSANAELGANPYAVVIDIPTNFRMVEFPNIRKVIGSTIFEGNSIPKEWVNHCGLMDEIWVPTEFNIESFSRGGVNASLLKKLRLAIDVDFWNANHPDNKTMMDRRDSEPVELLYISSLHRRKGLDKMMTAYFSEFSSQDNVKLTLSCFPIKSGGLTNEPINDGGDLKDYLTNLGMRYSGQTDRANLPAFDAHYTYWSDEELRKFFFRSHGYISSERADGWSLPIMQMMALGKPVGLLDWGGSSEYSSPDNAHLIPAGPLEPMDPVLCRSTNWYRSQAWPQMATEDLQASMRAIFEDILTKRGARAAKALDTVRTGYTYKIMGRAIAELIGFNGVAATGATSDGKVNVRPTPYEGTIHHILLAKVRRLMEQTGNRVTVLAPLQEDVTVLKQLAAKHGVRFSIVSRMNEITPAAAGNTRDSLVVFGDIDESETIELMVRFSEVYLLNRLTLVLDLVDSSQLRNRKKYKTGLYMSGGLTVPARKVLSGRGLMKSDLFSLVPPERAPGSWNGLPRNFPDKVDTSKYGAIFLADEDSKLQRQSYQNAEAFFPDCEIIKVLPTNPPNNQRPMNDSEIFAKSLPKRWSGANTASLTHVTTLPAAVSPRQLATVVTRMAYFISARSNVKISVPVSSQLLPIARENIQDWCAEFGNVTYGQLSSPVIDHIEFVSEEDVVKNVTAINNAAIIWNLKSLPVYQRRLLNEVENILLIDVDHPGMRSGFAAATADYFCRARQEVADLRRDSQRIFRQQYLKMRKSGKKKATIFGTGPSLASALETDFSDSLTVVCNTMVKDRELLQHLKPDVIVASDADFHFGPSRYAQAFRKDLCEVILEHNSIFVCPEAHAPLLLAHHPEIKPYLVAVPVEGVEENFDLIAEFRVRAIDNVLLQFLLPIASTISEEIQLVGFDGRKKNDVKFWSHNLNTQYADLMDTIEYSHPGFFFFRDYADYFERHCRLINEYITAIEGRGKNVVSLTDSGVPALSDRYSNKGATLVS